MSVTTDETIDVSRLLNLALALPVEDRATLANRLYDSLAPEDTEVERAWAIEIERRVREIESGEAELIDGEKVMAEVRELLAR